MTIVCISALPVRLMIDWFEQRSNYQHFSSFWHLLTFWRQCKSTLRHLPTRFAYNEQHIPVGPEEEKRERRDHSFLQGWNGVDLLCLKWHFVMQWFVIPWIVVSVCVCVCVWPFFPLQTNPNNDDDDLSESLMSAMKCKVFHKRSHQKSIKGTLPGHIQDTLTFSLREKEPFSLEKGTLLGQPRKSPGSKVSRMRGCWLANVFLFSP